MIAAKTRDTARALGQTFEAGKVSKRYWALVHGHPRQPLGFIEAPLGPDPLSLVAIKDCVRPDGQPAATAWRELQRWSNGDHLFSWLEVEPRTGRKHQIRIHLASIGHPIVGDKLYGLDERHYLDFVNHALTPTQCEKLMLPHHALHARSLSFAWAGREFVFEVEPEFWFMQFIRAVS